MATSGIAASQQRQAALFTQLNAFSSSFEAISTHGRWEFSDNVSAPPIDREKLCLDAAKKLEKLGLMYVRDLNTLSEDDALETIFNNQHLPESFVTRTFDQLSSPDLNSQDIIKASLIRVIRIFFEMLAMRYRLEKRSIPVGTHQSYTQILQSCKETLPRKNKQHRTKYEIERCQAVLKKIERGEGKWKILLKGSAPDLVKGLISATVSHSPEPLLGPFITLAFEVYQNLEESWYKEVWALQWVTLSAQLSTLQDLEQIHCLQKASHNTHFAIAVSDLFTMIASNPQADHDLRMRVISADDPSKMDLFKLAESSHRGFSKVRDITAQNLETLLYQDDERIATKASRILVTRLASEKKEYIREKIREALKSFAALHQEKVSTICDNCDQGIQDRTKLLEELKAEQAKELAAAMEHVPSEEVYKGPSSLSQKIVDLQGKIDSLQQEVETLRTFEEKIRSSASR